MRYTGEATIRLSGDESEAVKYISHGRKLMGELLRDKELGGVEQKSRVIRLHGGVVISALTFTGLHQIEIFVPPTVVDGEVEKNEYGFRTYFNYSTNQRYSFTWDTKEEYWGHYSPDPGRLSYDNAYTTYWTKNNSGKDVCLAFAGRRYDAPRGQATVYLDGFPLCDIPIEGEIVGVSKYGGALVVICHHTTFPYTLRLAYRKFKNKYSASDDAADSDYRWKTKTIDSKQFNAPLIWDGTRTETDIIIQTINFSEDGSKGTGLYSHKTYTYYTTSTNIRYYLRVFLSGDWQELTANVTYTATDYHLSADYRASESSSDGPDYGCDVCSHIGYYPGHGACYSCGYGTCYDCSLCEDNTGALCGGSCCVYYYCAYNDLSASASSSASFSTTASQKHVIAVDFKGNTETEATWGDEEATGSCSWSKSTSASETTSIVSERVLTVDGSCGHEENCLSQVFYYTSDTGSTSGSGSKSEESFGLQTIGEIEFDRYRITTEGYSSLTSSSEGWREWHVTNCCSNLNGCPGGTDAEDGSSTRWAEDCTTTIAVYNFLLQFDLRYDTYSYLEYTKTSTNFSLPTSTVYYVTVSPQSGTTRAYVGDNWFLHYSPQYPSTSPCAATNKQISGCSYGNSSSSGGTGLGETISPFQDLTYVKHSIPGYNGMSSVTLRRQNFTMEKSHHGQFLMSLFREITDPAQYIWESSKTYYSPFVRLDDYINSPVCNVGITGGCLPYPANQYYVSVLPTKFTKKVPQT